MNLRNYLETFPRVVLNARLSCMDAVKMLDASNALVLAVDDEGRLQGVVADSDIRKALLRGVELTLPISEIMTTTPACVTSKDPIQELMDLQQSKHHIWVPVVDSEHRPVALVNTRELFGRSVLHSNNVVILAGGRGMRLRPLTEETPKPMLPVGGRPLLEIIIERLRESGFLNISLSVNYLAERITEHFGDGGKFGVSISYLRENEPLGTAGCLGLLKSKPVEPVIVINGDVLTGLDFERLLEYHHNEGRIITTAVWKHHVTIPYGVVKLEDTIVREIEEKPEFEYYVNAGVYVISPEALDLVPRGCPYDMPELIRAVIERQGMGVGCFPVREYWLDIGCPKDYLQANNDATRRKDF
ncbi:nucleotidyltransferase family protein [Pseudodesulfovibrio pelocollis]|uniref:nucleotidyltransferase family protein n=1 Tax=Pseudodesulfovibrio pelocollis TaxID=3051432 RepID=UPI00255A8A4E|nr:nucleotidyltransferase family protein [Pseudodesulfovibrio sp. SB368]